MEKIAQFSLCLCREVEEKVAEENYLINGVNKHNK